MGKLKCLKIFKTLGELIKEVANERLNSGTHQVEYTVENIPAGTYYYSMETEKSRVINKLVITH